MNNNEQYTQGELIYLTKDILFAFKSFTKNMYDYVNIKKNDCLIYVGIVKTDYSNKYYAPRVGEFVYCSDDYVSYIKKFSL